MRMEVKSVTGLGGTGTYNQWDVNIGGAPGRQGPTGSTGPTGYTGISGDLYKTTSTTSISLNDLQIGDTISPSIESGLSYTAGQEVVFGVNGSGANNNFVGNVNSYVGTQMSIKISSVTGTGGPYTQWMVNLNGAPGTPGDTGPTGPTGYTGYTGLRGDIYKTISPTLVTLDNLVINTLQTMKLVDPDLSYSPGQEVIFAVNANQYFTGRVDTYTPYWSSTSSSLAVIIISIIGEEQCKPV